MTIAGSLEQIGVNLARMSKPRGLLAWQQTMESRGAVRNIGRAVKDYDQEIKGVTKKDLSKLLRAHDQFERDIEKALNDLRDLSTNTFIEFANLRTALLKQRELYQRIQSVIPEAQRRPFEAKIAANVQKYKADIEFVNDCFAEWTLIACLKTLKIKK